MTSYDFENFMLAFVLYPNDYFILIIVCFFKVCMPNYRYNGIRLISHASLGLPCLLLLFFFIQEKKSQI